jgi:hypothetical protein
MIILGIKPLGWFFLAAEVIGMLAFGWLDKHFVFTVKIARREHK